MRKGICFGLFMALLLGFVFAALPLPVRAMTGSGSEGDPYIIYNITDLQNMSNNLSAYYELANDIDASATTTWNWDAGRGVYEGFVPVGAFSGHFDGNYYTIDGLYMDRYSASTYVNAGLFSIFSGNAYVGNVLITSANITARSNCNDCRCNVGVLVGDSGDTSDITVERVVVLGVVHGTATDGGGIRLDQGAGGLIGYLYEGNGIIEECGAYVDVTFSALSQAMAFAGGFVGYYGTYYGSTYEIKNCYAMGDVVATYDAYPHAAAGGFVGERHPGSDGLKITNCYSIGTASGAQSGGFVGENYEGGGGSCAGLYDNFWDKDTSGHTISDCDNAGQIEAKSTSEMKTQSTFTDVGWDFETVWHMKGAKNDGYPYLIWWYDPFIWEDYEAYQVLWFQPNNIISGTTLPDRAETEDGTITWGANPAGISITISGFMSEYQLPMYVLPVDIVEDPLDMVGPTGQPGWTSDIPSLTGHPFYPVVAMIGNQTGIPIKLVWVIFATLLLLIAMMVCYRYAPHQIITVIVGGSICAFWYHMEIYPFWVIFIFVVMGVAIIIGEKSPTVS